MIDPCSSKLEKINNQSFEIWWKNEIENRFLNQYESVFGTTLNQRALDIFKELLHIAWKNGAFIMQQECCNNGFKF